MSDEKRAAGARLSVGRRSFLKTVGAAPLAASLVTPAEAEAQAARVLGPGEAPLDLVINGKKYSLKVEPRVTLLDALRTRLKLTGLKRVCDRGTCGACTMIVGDRAVYACSLLAIEAQGQPIRTIEGLATGTVLHKVQQAFCDQDALMCGFCTPGMIMATVALLERHPNPTAELVRRELDGNVCRCGTYVRVVEAALKAGGVSRG
jgi:xanthine dehydrogenase YagT iron-sulfur-binding subunit